MMHKHSTTFLLMTITLITPFFSVSAKQAVDPMVESAILERIKPVGQVTVGGAQETAAAAPVVAASPVDGKSVYNGTCMACHGTGAAGAPKMGDKAAWKPRIAKGMDTLLNHALNGFNAMPPRGGRADLSDDSVKAAIEYMVANSK